MTKRMTETLYFEWEMDRRDWYTLAALVGLLASGRTPTLALEIAEQLADQALGPPSLTSSGEVPF